MSLSVQLLSSSSHHVSFYLCFFFFFFLMIRRPPRSTLFPYTRSSDLGGKCLPITLVDSVALVAGVVDADRKSTRLNSSHQLISYAVFCLKKKNNLPQTKHPRTPHGRLHTQTHHRFRI